MKPCHVFVRFLLAVFLVPAVMSAALAQPAGTASINGFVEDASSGETLIGANVYLSETEEGAATNTSGYFTMPGLAPGSYTLVCSYVGYTPYRTTVELEAGEELRLDIELVPKGVEIDEVVVRANRETAEDVRRLGGAQLDTELIKEAPAVLEPDVFRSLQLLPGVAASSDYSSGLYIRGGSPDQTLILLDNTTVYNPSHFFGLFSTFNPDAIKDVRLYKGAYPAEYGGRLGSVVDIYNKDGNRRRTGGNLSLGLLASRAMIEGPHPMGSWMLAVRRSTLEPLLGVLNRQEVEGIPEGFYFYDVNGKINLDVSGNDRFSLAFYAGTDNLEFPFSDDAQINVQYGNRTMSANWTHVFSDRLFSNLTVTGSRYFSTPRFEIAGTPFERDNTISDYSARGDLELALNENHELEVGFWGGHFDLLLADRFDGEETVNADIPSIYTYVYLQDTYEPNARWTIRGGLRGSYFERGGYLRWAPRLSAEYQPSTRVRLQAGYGRYHQFLTLISSEVFSGFDTWLTTGRGVAPAYGDQAAVGVKLELPQQVTVDVEGYFRTMEDLFELDPRISDVAGLEYNELFHFGEGYAYGAEFLLERRRGQLTGHLAYTYGITRRRYPDLNDGAYYPPKYDRTHDIKALLNYKLSDHWRVSMVFSWSTGQAYTRPTARYRLSRDPFQSGPRSVFMTSFNNRRLPAYHRLDLGISRMGRFFGVADYRLQLQLINAYSRRNIWFYLFEFEGDAVDRTEVPQIPVPLPNISFSLDF
jgi:hypothetical protein